MGTKLDPGKFNCYANALLDEPMITFLARDPDMPETIRFWKTLREARIGRGEKPASDHAMLTEASSCAIAAAIWREENKFVTIPQELFGKPIDPFVGARWHYESPPVADDMHRALEEEVVRLRNALALRSAEALGARAQIAETDGNDALVSRLTEHNRVLRQTALDLNESLDLHKHEYDKIALRVGALEEENENHSTESVTMGRMIEKLEGELEAARAEIAAWQTEAADRTIEGVSGNNFRLDFDRLNVLITILGPQGKGKSRLAEVIQDYVQNDERVEQFSATFVCNSRQTSVDKDLHLQFRFGPIRYLWDHETRPPLTSLAAADMPTIKRVTLAGEDVTDRVRFDVVSDPYAEMASYMRSTLDHESAGIRRIRKVRELGMGYGGDAAGPVMSDEHLAPYRSHDAWIKDLLWPTAEQMIADCQRVASISNASKNAVKSAILATGCAGLHELAGNVELWEPFRKAVVQIEIDHSCGGGARGLQP